VTSKEEFEISYPLEAGMAPLVKNGEEVMEGQELARHPATEALIRTRHAGIAKVGKKEITVKTVDEESREYLIPHGARIRPELERRDQKVSIKAGQQITEGSISPQELLHILGKEAVQTFLVDEVQRVYRSQGVDINDKHIEVIVRQMMRKVRIDSAGDTNLLPGEIVSQWSTRRPTRRRWPRAASRPRRKRCCWASSRPPSTRPPGSRPPPSRRRPGAHRGRHQRQGGPPPWSQGERDHRQADSPPGRGSTTTRSSASRPSGTTKRSRSTSTP